MATKVYFEDAFNLNTLSPAISSGWTGSATGFERHLLNISGTKEGSAHYDVTTTIAALTELCQIQYVSEQLQAQTISGTVDIGIKQRSSATGATFFAYVIRVVTSGGASRGTLLDMSANTANGINSSSYTDEFDGAQTLSSVVCSQGDRLVIEIGYDVNNSTSKTFGCKTGTASATDVTSDSTSTTLRNGNAIFSGDILFGLGGTPNQMMMMGCGT